MACSWALITIQMLTLLLSPEDVHVLQKEVFHCASVHFERAMADRRWRCFWIMFTFDFFVERQTFNLNFWMAHWTVLTDDSFWKCSRAHSAISITESWRFVMQCHLKAWRDPKHSVLILRYVQSLGIFGWDFFAHTFQHLWCFSGCSEFFFLYNL